ncbi:MAG: dynamin family protein, partial [Campylobacterota bacterium]|nr:dynamin family protein [Campylobacterota bacterium]
IQKLTIDKSLASHNKEMAELLEATVGTVKKSTQNWVDNFENMLELEKFNSYLENYFIIIIFGKVKAGKSSLGNFIAKNRPSHEEAEFFKYDEAGKEQAIDKLEEMTDDDESFDTATIECTTEIQGFRLNGMAWIDTPGLGSMVAENGELAQKYINAAHYVIYPTNSAQPLQRDEISQVEELFSANKKVTICITRSDIIERRKENGKYIKEDGKIKRFRVNKPTDRREAQEKHANREVQNIMAKGKESKLGDIFSISALTASMGLEDNDETLFNNSNMPKFYELMTEVIKEKSDKLKAGTPYDGLTAFVDNSILGGKQVESTTTISSLKESLSKLDEKIIESLDAFERIKQNLNSDINMEVDSIVSQYTNSIDKDNAKEKFNTIDKKLSKNISQLIATNINEIMEDFSTTLDGLNSALDGGDSFDIKDEYKKIEVRYADRSFLNIVTLGILGRSESSTTEEVRVGDNKTDMILKFKQNRIDGYIKASKENYDVVGKDFFEPLQKVSKSITNGINELESKIINLKNNLKG